MQTCISAKVISTIIGRKHRSKLTFHSLERIANYKLSSLNEHQTLPCHLILSVSFSPINRRAKLLTSGIQPSLVGWWANNLSFSAVQWKVMLEWFSYLVHDLSRFRLASALRQDEHLDECVDLKWLRFSAFFYCLLNYAPWHRILYIFFLFILQIPVCVILECIFHCLIFFCVCDLLHFGHNQ